VVSCTLLEVDIGEGILWRRRMYYVGCVLSKADVVHRSSRSTVVDAIAPDDLYATAVSMVFLHAPSCRRPVRPAPMIHASLVCPPLEGLKPMLVGYCKCWDPP
jgi:hypothetical protein